eukprot:1156014-Pelagomonas_calceolata.AAC.18
MHATAHMGLICVEWTGFQAILAGSVDASKLHKCEACQQVDGKIGTQMHSGFSSNNISEESTMMKDGNCDQSFESSPTAQMLATNFLPAHCGCLRAMPGRAL